MFVERLWKTIKYEHVDLHAYASISGARAKFAVYIDFCNGRTVLTNTDRALILENGCVVLEDSSESLVAMPQELAARLGV